MRFSIDQSVLEKILNYVATKPYHEVASLLIETQQDVIPIEELEVKENENKENENKE